jgi:hypothetical protein
MLVSKFKLLFVSAPAVFAYMTSLHVALELEVPGKSIEVMVPLDDIRTMCVHMPDQFCSKYLACEDEASFIGAIVYKYMLVILSFVMWAIISKHTPGEGDGSEACGFKIERRFLKGAVSINDRLVKSTLQKFEKMADNGDVGKEVFETLLRAVTWNASPDPGSMCPRDAAIVNLLSDYYPSKLPLLVFLAASNFDFLIFCALVYYALVSGSCSVPSSSFTLLTVMFACVSMMVALGFLEMSRERRTWNVSCTEIIWMLIIIPMHLFLLVILIYMK